MTRRARWFVGCFTSVTLLAAAGCGNSGSNPVLYPEVRFDVAQTKDTTSIGQTTFTLETLQAGGTDHASIAGRTFVVPFSFVLENAPLPYRSSFKRSADGGEITITVSVIAQTGEKEVSDSTLPAQTHALAIDPGNPSTLYAGTDLGVFQSTNSGNSWSAVDTGLSDTALSVTALVIDPAAPGTLYAGTDGGVFRSTNSGGSWSAVNTGLSSTAPSVTALAIDPTTLGTLYAGTHGGVFQSINSGGSWSAVNTGLSGTALSVAALAIDPTPPGTLYAGTAGGVFQSTDSGGSWTAVNTGLSGTALSVTALAIDPTMPGTLYAGTHGGVFESTNSGGSWSAVNTGLSGNGLSVTALAIDLTTPGTIYTGTAGGVFQSTDSGGSWSAVNTGLSGTALTVLALGIAPSTLYAGTNGGLFRSTDNGASWSPAVSGLTRKDTVRLGCDNAPDKPLGYFCGPLGADPLPVPAANPEVRFDVCAPFPGAGSCATTDNPPGIIGIPFSGSLGDLLNSHSVSGLTPRIFFLEGAQHSADARFLASSNEVLEAQLFVNGQLRPPPVLGSDVIIREDL
jgi:photosystem II stability/assembly factor-like uncharacterized protein